MTSFFKSINLDALGGHNTLVYMTPDEYLSLIIPFKGKPSKIQRINEVIQKGEKLDDIPLLLMHDSGAILGHNGRHRAMVMKGRDVDKMPVCIKHTYIMKGYNHLPFPRVLIGEDEISTVKAPWDEDKDFQSWIDEHGKEKWSKNDETI